jgi:hypothetical protein
MVRYQNCNFAFIPALPDKKTVRWAGMNIFDKENAMKYQKPKIVAGNKTDGVFAAGCKQSTGFSCNSCRCN